MNWFLCFRILWVWVCNRRKKEARMLTLMRVANNMHADELREARDYLDTLCKIMKCVKESDECK
jgi:hypothetical protein